MSDESSGKPDPRQEFEESVGKKEARRMQALRRGEQGAWFGLGMFGLIGWSVVIPTLIGLAVGLWIDSTWPSGYSWTLMCLILGVGMGCYNAWQWLEREGQAREKPGQENDTAAQGKQHEKSRGDGP